MKKKSAKLITLVFLSNIAFITLSAQENIEIDSRLKNGYQIEYLQNLQSNSPSTLLLLTYNLDNSWFIADEKISAKIESMEYLYYKNPETQEKTENKVQSIDLNNINIATFYYEREHNANKFYKIGNTGVVIGFYSATENANRFNNHKNQ